MTYSRVADGALTGLVLRIFARVYGTAGIVVTLLVMGHARLVPDAAAQVVGMAGGALLAVACVAWGMASVPDSSTRRDLLRWFLVGHAVFLFAMFAWQLGGGGGGLLVVERAVLLRGRAAVVHGLPVAVRRPVADVAQGF